MDNIIGNQNTFGVSPSKQIFNNGPISQVSPGRSQQRSPLKNNIAYQKELLIQKCENSNPNLFKKYPHIYHNIMEIIDQFFREGKINEKNMDFLQQKVQKEIQFQLNKLRTSNKIGLIDNLFYNNPNLQQQSRMVHNLANNSPLQNGNAIKAIDFQTNQDVKTKRQSIKAVNNSNGELSSGKQGKQVRSESTNHRVIPDIKPLNLGFISNQATVAETPSNLNIPQVQGNIYSSMSKNKQNNIFGKAARSSSYMGDVAKKNLVLEQILQKNKGSFADNQIKEQMNYADRNNYQQQKRLNTQENDIIGIKSDNKNYNYYSSNQRNQSNPRVDSIHNSSFDIQPSSNKFSQPFINNIQSKPKNFGTIAQNNILYSTAINYSDLEKNKNNRSINGGNGVKDGDNEYQKEIKKLMELEQDYEKQRIQSIKEKEKYVFETIRKQWDKQIDWKKSEALKEKETDKEYKKNIEILLQEEIHLNQLKSSEKKKLAVDEKQHVFQQILLQKEQKERQRSQEIEKERMQIMQNEHSIKNEKEQHRIIQLNKIQQQNQMIVEHIQLSKNLRENQEKQSRLDELKRIKDQIAQQHVIDQRKDDEYIHRIGKISKRIY